MFEMTISGPAATGVFGELSVDVDGPADWVVGSVVPAHAVSMAADNTNDELSNAICLIIFAFPPTLSQRPVHGKPAYRGHEYTLRVRHPAPLEIRVVAGR